MRAVKLMDQYLVPAIFAGACGAWQGEKESAISNAAGAARLHGGSLYVLVTQHPKQFTKPGNGFVIQFFKGFRGNIAASDTGSSSGDHNVYF